MKMIVLFFRIKFGELCITRKRKKYFGQSCTGRQRARKFFPDLFVRAVDAIVRTYSFFARISHAKALLVLQ